MKKIIDFLAIAEKLECEYRLTRMSDGMPQAVASHSWNMAMMAIVLQPYFQNDYDIRRVMELCLIHDLPEAIAHDVPLHKQTPRVRREKHVAETAAIKQIMDIVQNKSIADLFAEYDARQSKESQLVKALDVMDTAVQHMCAKDLAYIGSFDNGFYWKLFFDDEFAKMFDFEPVLRRVLDEIRTRVSIRLKEELNINAGDFVK
ncbi:MAG: HD domain-containing protein [Alphaproteobacteria bacterium]|nr:HD domain-containing protein [Alphaproteobacteria bacterium]